MLWWLNLATALGTVILAVPVWQLNRNKKLLQRIKDVDGAGMSDSDFRDQIRRLAEEKQKERVAEWRAWHEACLWTGYSLVALGATGRLFVS